MGGPTMLGDGSHTTDQGEAALTAANRAAMALFYKTAQEALPASHRLVMGDANVWASALSACVQGCIYEVPYVPDPVMIAYALGAALGAVVGAPSERASLAFTEGMATAASVKGARSPDWEK